MKATKSTKSNDKADARQLIVRAVNAEKEAAAARKQARLAKIRYKQARKAFKQAKKAAKQARKEAKIAANTFQAKAEKAKKPQKNRTKSKKHIKVATRKAPATARRPHDPPATCRRLGSLPGVPAPRMCPEKHGRWANGGMRDVPDGTRRQAPERDALPGGAAKTGVTRADGQGGPGEGAC